jgi:hypothetical protein
MTAAGWLDANGQPADPTLKTPQQGAATHVWAATSPLLEGKGGLYCEDCDLAPLDTGAEPSLVRHILWSGERAQQSPWRQSQNAAHTPRHMTLMRKPGLQRNLACR